MFSEVISGISVKGSSDSLAMSVRWMCEHSPARIHSVTFPLPQCGGLKIHPGRRQEYSTLQPIGSTGWWCRQDHMWGWSGWCVCRPIQGCTGWLEGLDYCLLCLTSLICKRAPEAVSLVKEDALWEKELSCGQGCTSPTPISRRNSFWAPLPTFFYESLWGS